jgi:O-methyltransferase involved in polyketide biosynthesis
MPDFDTSVPHIARVYDYWLGGKDNFAADRVMGERTLQAYPNLVFSVRANRAFLARAVRFLAGQGIRQFLDIGTGIPTANNTHEVAQRIAPDSRIVYVDNDPVVLSHAKALLKSTPEGVCAYLDADLRDPDAILAAAAQTLDFGQPVAVMLIAVMHFVGDDAQASAIMRRLTAACVPGSYVALSHAASDIDATQMAEMIRRLNESTAEKTTLRDRAGVTRLFDGLEPVEPGVIRAAEWRPDTDLEAASPAALWGGVARKPG